MGLTNQSVGLSTTKEMLNVDLTTKGEYVIGLAGNPNTGKSTIFNELTGLKQHTGNWPGKTVTNTWGKYTYDQHDFVVVDLPGTYSLIADSVEEEVARNFICIGQPDATVVVTDATCIERNLNLVLQILELTDKVIVCVNLMDEAKRKNIHIDLKHLSSILGIPVIGTNARSGIGLTELKQAVLDVTSHRQAYEPIQVHYPEEIVEAVHKLEPILDTILDKSINRRWFALRIIEGNQKLIHTILDEANISPDFLANEEITNIIQSVALKENTIRESLVTSIIKTSEEIYNKVVKVNNTNYNKVDRKIDKIVTSKFTGIPIMLLLLGAIFWITIIGANYPSGMLANFFARVEGWLTDFFIWINSPEWLYNIIVLGIYRTLSWVISVMLPPMAIFFPLFTLLEDLGYLPRIAFNLDYFFKKCKAHGKQALTMCMGFGCNAAGIISCRIINSPRERLIAIITNNFVPCNGRFPTLIALATIFIAGTSIYKSFWATFAVLGAIVLAVIITLIISRLLSSTILKGLPSSFTLELPPYRRPQIGKVIVRSIFDRTLFVLGRAIVVAAPAGIIIWLMQNISVGSYSLLAHCANFLDPFAHLMGLDGYILMAFILGLPANEIVIPILIMAYMSAGSMLELDSLESLKQLLVNNGWTWLTAVCTMIFSLNHFPCGTALLTIKKETQSTKWTLVSFIVPTITGIVLCIIVATGVRLLHLV